MQLTASHAAALAAMPLKFLRQQYPNHIMHLLNSDADVRSPRELHPVFYGCYDWHSAVHGYWLLLRILRLYPDLSCRQAISELFDEHFTADNILAETEYFRAPSRAAFERPYGYGWLLALAHELAVSTCHRAVYWRACLQPLILEIHTRLVGYLEKLSYPIRVGTHANSAFAMLLAWDYATAIQDRSLQQAIHSAAMRFYLSDTSYPWHYEPAGDDFLSGALIEALLMSRLLDTSVPQHHSPTEFSHWFDSFLPDFQQNTVFTTPAQITDRTDPKIAHLDGLNLSRAWCMKQLARTLPENHPATAQLFSAAQHHLQASASYVTDSHYNGGHWLATFALLALTA